MVVACRGVEIKLVNLRRSSPEERLAVQVLAGALRADLALPLAGTYLVHQEWRLPEGGRVDLLAVEPAFRCLVIIELKGSERKARTPDPKKGGDA